MYDGAEHMAYPRSLASSPGSRRLRAMSNGPYVTLAELDKQIAIIRDNIREITEQAAAMSGAADEERNADRLAQQNEELERLMKLREELLKKK